MHALDVDWDHPADPGPGPRLDHVRAYVASAGVDGHLWHGVRTLLLTTVDRATGRTVRTPLIYGEDADRVLLVASGHGAPEHPRWYRNLTTHPEVRFQAGAAVHKAAARTATPQERDAYWPLMTALWPPYDDDQAGTDREIPLVVLEP
ncbi:nitroreductase family deazaflavin-dependent oxidoreductase [Streptomyces subrutilus]|uniref:Nitroreductase n=1 Tax=Streptomyces subrutilus TaxID=36818 RepID=A0A5P2UN63_9ACTN|nr:nitroreductase family deazaflavin-dependent oxidoreductase [Streptomyces subrutilus]QEU79051.1 nitroreductase family deazaflavin-dependent oxidoreductase [Streptomyces subrutilus]WSJ31767.1 nitroreductase family deazaflavin-dependent oxidoreductase [Streptomyces subrutilus]GGZ76906.1 nitroreductase [Streptomyces subrutilus]